ncbi:lysophospholipid acyltransferase family protein [Defluviimonas sp. WL0024]|uniref:Lysophospholipid acyltransferase family protein n=2 Tax=Albidovulum TaxID=205889 RepID=A0ABT3J3C0_9RHOB|nr:MULTISPECIES: lysophospholipid acyltransferase family protein [Defluviimonas]MCU9848755.1 lysophospholipid acyltransferase family protein [Defluviimonas sp. WL0024]MCW3782181.1 lysophospholipid acyltransferase family protein [Defluviimonas salinarum]
MTAAPDSTPSRSDRLIDAAFRALLAVARALPYRIRIPVAGWIVSRIAAPIAGWTERIRENLAHVCPDLPPAEVARLVRAVPDNVGRSMIEMYSGQEFADRQRDVPLLGEGVEALAEAKRTGRPVILVTGHFGNYNAARAALVAHGYQFGGLYRPMKNPLFNAHYVDAMQRISSPLFPRGKQGMGAMLRFIKSGGMLGILLDQHMGHGAPLRFFGRTAHTATSAADLALKYDAAMIPVYGIRKPDGLGFDVVVEAPIPPSDPMTMTQAANDSLELLTRQHMDQWFWIHRRWK